MSKRMKHPLQPVDAAHEWMIARLQGNKPHVVRHGYADAADLEEIAEHLNKAFEAFADYVEVNLAHIDDNSPVHPFGAKRRAALAASIKEKLDALSDQRRDIIGTIVRASEDARENED